MKTRETRHDGNKGDPAMRMPLQNLSVIIRRGALLLFLRNGLRRRSLFITEPRRPHP
jgi:hypothetical protein